jgi:hypothetical protein
MPVLARHPVGRESIQQSLVRGLLRAISGPVLIHFFLGVFTVFFAPPAACDGVPLGTPGWAATRLSPLCCERTKGRL